MKSFLRASAIGFLVLASVLVVTVELICRAKGDEWRIPLYAGGAAGFSVNLLSFPFMLKLAAMPAEKMREGACWNWWVPGVLVRMAAIGMWMQLASGKFPGRENGVTLTAVAVYMAGMFAELAWLAKRFNAMDKR